MARVTITKTLGDLLADVHSEMDGMKDELQNWLDGLPENLQGGQKAEELEEAISLIENVDEVECPTALKKVEVSWVESTRKRSRSDRRVACTAAMAAAVELIESMPEDKGGVFGALKDAIQAAHDEYEAVSFPGMH